MLDKIREWGSGSKNLSGHKHSLNSNKNGGPEGPPEILK
jgi:hypothetical protein